MRIITAASPTYAALLAMSKRQNEARGYAVTVLAAPAKATASYDGTTFITPAPYKPRLIGDALRICDDWTAWIDCDAFAIRRFDEVAMDDYDVGVTMCRREHRNQAFNHPLGAMLCGFLNSGVVFFNRTPQARQFADLWAAQIEREPSRDDQVALNRLVLQCTDLTEYNRVFRLGDIRLKVFRSDDYNFYYWPEEPFPQTKIVHLYSPNRCAASVAHWGGRVW